MTDKHAQASHRRPSLLSPRLLIAVAALAFVYGAGCAKITEVQPDPAAQGSEVTITGSGFGETQGESQLLYDNAPISVVTWSRTSIVATLPNPKADGTYDLSVVVHGKPATVQHTISNPVTCPCWDQSDLDLLVSECAAGAAALEHFSPPNYTFYNLECSFLDPLPANYLSYVDSDSCQLADFRDGDPDRVSSVTPEESAVCSNLIESTWANLPHITAVQPDPAAPGTEVTVTGSGFGATQGAAQLLYDNAAMSVVTWSETSIVATLPNPKPDGTYDLSVVVDGNAATVQHTISNPVPITCPCWDQSDLDILVSECAAGNGHLSYVFPPNSGNYFFVCGDLQSPGGSKYFAETASDGSDTYCQLWDLRDDDPHVVDNSATPDEFAACRDLLDSTWANLP